MTARSTFGRHRKIMPFEPGAVDDLRRSAREKAASLNQHVLGYGETSEREWAAAGIPAPGGVWPIGGYGAGGGPGAGPGAGGGPGTGAGGAGGGVACEP